MDNEIADQKSIDLIASEINRREFPYISAFADAVIRYLEIIVRRDRYNRLEWAILIMLVTNRGSLSPATLAKQLLRSQHSITLLVDNLEKLGYVKRERKSNDRRIVDICITNSGIEHILHTLPKADKNWDTLLSELNQDERSFLISLLRKLRKLIIMHINSGL